MRARYSISDEGSSSEIVFLHSLKKKCSADRETHIFPVILDMTPKTATCSSYQPSILVSVNF